MSLVQLEAASTIDVTAMQRELESRIEGEVNFDVVHRSLYSTDASVYQIPPVGVVVVRSRQDILTALEICRRYRCPITMRGGGTSQGGQSIGHGLLLDTSKYFAHVIEANVSERWVKVQPGIVLDELNAQLSPFGLRFAPDISTASRATIGGMMGNNSSGARSVIYGKTIDHVLEMTVALADGSIVEFRDVPRDEIPHDEGTLEAACYETVTRLGAQHAAEIERRFPKVMRRVGGYNLNEFTDPSKPVNLTKMMIGSEGTLGIVLEAKLKLVPLPKAKAVMVVMFADLLESLSAVPLILMHRPSAVEVMDKSILDFTRQNATLDRIRTKYIYGDPASTLCIEFYADDKEHLPPRLAALEADLRRNHLGYAYRQETDPAAQARIWSLREASLGLSMAMKEDAKSVSFVEDTAVAPEKLRDYIEQFLRIVHKHDTTAGIYAHASVGCLHVRPVINLKTETGVKKFEAIANDVADLVLSFGGALSGEHGDGYLRSPFMSKMFGPELYEAFREIKRTFDPLGILNPGKITDSPPLTSNLRFGAGYKTENPHTIFDFSEYGGFAGAVEMCSGVGACRKKLTGNMCPSYMVTRDEAHTTRGRANVLRMAMSGRLAEAGLDDRGVMQVLDLCLECRACKSECPVGVDMARFKSEYLAGYYERHGTPLKARALGNIHKMCAVGSLLAPLSNWWQTTEAGKSLNERLFHIDKRRTLPKWKNKTFERWLHGRPSAPGRGPTVHLFNDTFTNHYDPEIGIASIEILERCGVNVKVVKPGCCGRPLISQGLLQAAQAQASIVVNGLYPIASAGEKILFCEPSCLSAVKEDHPALLRGDDQRKAKVVAGACILFDEFAANLDLPIQGFSGRILMHGHCHQKSMGMMQATNSLLARIPDASVIDLDAGCCGMAGSFGYDKDHYSVSVAMANRKLLPAVREKQPGDVVVATGTSCRHQVVELTGVNAVHPSILIRSLL